MEYDVEHLSDPYILRFSLEGNLLRKECMHRLISA